MNNCTKQIRGGCLRKRWRPAYRFGFSKDVPKNRVQKFLESKKYKSLTVLKVYFHASDVF